MQSVMHTAAASEIPFCTGLSRLPLEASACACCPQCPTPRQGYCIAEFLPAPRPSSLSANPSQALRLLLLEEGLLAKVV